MAEGSPPPDHQADVDADAGKVSRLLPWQQRLPDWLNHFNGDDLKVVFRCWVAVWVAGLLIFINPALQNIGIATFFASIVLFIVPPASILFTYLLAATTLLLGMCLAWAWGLVTMKAAYAARSATETAEKLRALQQAAIVQANATGVSTTTAATILVHNGFMLDARVTVIHFVLCLLFIYALARLRCANDKVILLQIFGTIVIDLTLLIGPTLPSFNDKVPEVLVKPGAIGIGIGAACSLLIFPQSASYVVLRRMEQLVLMGTEALDASRRRFAGEPVDMRSLQASRGRIIGAFKTMEPLLAFLPLDISRGLWNASDVKSLQARVRATMLSCLLLLDFQIASVSANDRILKAKEIKINGNVEKKQTSASIAQGEDKDSSDNGNHSNHSLSYNNRNNDNNANGGPQGALSRVQTSQSIEVIAALKGPEQNAVSTETMEILKITIANLLQVCSLSTRLAAECIGTVNTSRWGFRPPRQTLDQLTVRLVDMLERLRHARDLCSTDTTEAILRAHANLFDAQGRFTARPGPGPHSLAGIVLSFAVEEHIINMTKIMQTLLEHLVHLTRTRKEARLWIPTRLQHAVNWLMHGRVSVPVAGVGCDDTTDPDVLEKAYRRLRQSQGADGTVIRRRRSGLGHAINSSYRWLIDPAGIYALRMVVVTLATSIPAVLPHTAGFFYREKGIWAVITAQTCLLFYMADFAYSLVSRLLGTLVGGVMALVAWYMGSARGNGNPYGMAAVSALMAMILMWWRVFLPPSTTQATIIGGVTFVLIVGFSWDEHHIAQYGLPGLGYVAFWKRLVTVLIGFAAAVIVQLFPRTPSATGHMRKTLANTVRTLSDHYALVLSHWSRPEKDEDSPSPLEKAAQTLSLEVAETLYSLKGSISLINFELSSSPFDQKSLRQTHNLCQSLNQALGRLLYLSAILPKELQDRMAQTVGLLDRRNIGSIMAILSIVEQTLRTCSSVPGTLPTPLLQNYLEPWHAEHAKVELSRELVRNEDYRRYCIAVSSYLRFLATLDDLIEVLKKALGESHVVCPLDRTKADISVGCCSESRSGLSGV